MKLLFAAFPIIFQCLAISLITITAKKDVKARVVVVIANARSIIGHFITFKRDLSMQNLTQINAPILDETVTSVTDGVRDVFAKIVASIPETLTKDEKNEIQLLFYHSGLIACGKNATLHKAMNDLLRDFFLKKGIGKARTTRIGKFPKAMSGLYSWISFCIVSEEFKTCRSYAYSENVRICVFRIGLSTAQIGCSSNQFKKPSQDATTVQQVKLKELDTVTYADFDDIGYLTHIKKMFGVYNCEEHIGPKKLISSCVHPLSIGSLYIDDVYFKTTGNLITFNKRDRFNLCWDATRTAVNMYSRDMFQTVAEMQKAVLEFNVNEEHIFAFDNLFSIFSIIAKVLNVRVTKNCVVGYEMTVYELSYAARLICEEMPFHNNDTLMSDDYNYQYICLHVVYISYLLSEVFNFPDTLTITACGENTILGNTLNITMAFGIAYLRAKKYFLKKKT